MGQSKYLWFTVLVQGVREAAEEEGQEKALGLISQASGHSGTR